MEQYHNKDGNCYMIIYASACLEISRLLCPNSVPNDATYHKKGKETNCTTKNLDAAKSMSRVQFGLKSPKH